MPPEESGKPTVLLVEDDPDDRMIAQHAFDRAAPGVRLRMAYDGENAVAYLSGEGVYSARAEYPLPQVVLLDLKLPRKSGFEVLQWMRAQPRLKELPVFIFSSSQERGDIERAYALGANSYLVKQADIRAVRILVRGIEAYAGMVTGAQPENGIPNPESRIPGNPEGSYP